MKFLVIVFYLLVACSSRTNRGAICEREISDNLLLEGQLIIKKDTLIVATDGSFFYPCEPLRELEIGVKYKFHLQTKRIYPSDKLMGRPCSILGYSPLIPPNNARQP